MPAAVAAAVAVRRALETFAWFSCALAGAARRSAPMHRLSVRLIHLGTLLFVRGWRVELVEPAQDGDRLSAQTAVEGAPVRFRQLARAMVELGVADLAVLGVASSLQLRPLGALARLVRETRAQRPGHE